MDCSLNSSRFKENQTRKSAKERMRLKRKPETPFSTHVHLANKTFTLSPSLQNTLCDSWFTDVQTPTTGFQEKGCEIKIHRTFYYME